MAGILKRALYFGVAGLCMVAHGYGFRMGNGQQNPAAPLNVVRNVAPLLNAAETLPDIGEEIEYDECKRQHYVDGVDSLESFDAAEKTSERDEVPVHVACVGRQWKVG